MGVRAHSQLRDHPLELVGVRSSGLSHEDAGAGLQLHAARGPRQGHALHLLAVHEERGGRTVHAERQARPLAGEGGQIGRAHV